ncbi:N-6 DNA methylase [Plantactinospora sp. KLBMP9567]|uniref:N-6 DNA methylase n=1 Tax=Plantactinospora sp. KLBMP9567 TaxID=3085900 RepID=UPI002980F67D|nr:N-6 DNA methylase [Plantactinospora sp. KLBMP9567]MDW5329574.1 N-6 DNA methylase [Plantactinospora sp. KLBMP9567]
MVAERRLMTRAEVAQAAGVKEQAVSLWVSRHPSFPPTVRNGRRVGYPIDAVADWLDNRKIHQKSRRADDPPGLTYYGQRFRAAVGLAAAPDHGDGVKQWQSEPQQRLRAWVDQLRVDSEDPVKFEAVVMSLMYVRAMDLAGWAALAGASVRTIQATVAEVTRRLPPPLTAATAQLRDLPTGDWWPRRLRRLVAKLNAAPASAADTFEYLLDLFARRRHHSPDEYLVPGTLARLMVALVDPQPGERVHDPCCGPGTLLVAAGQHLARSGEPAVDDPPTVLTGRATTARTWRLATLNTAIHELQCGLPAKPPDPAHANKVDAGPGRYDVVLLNPPFGKTEWEPVSRTEREWLCGRPAAYDTASAWLQTVVAALAPGGRAAVVMPNRFASNLSDQQRPVREGLVEHGVVRCVITLPRNLFRETAIPVTVWILAHPEDPPREDILLIDARQATRADGSYRVLTGDGCAAILDTYRCWLHGSTALSHAISTVTAVAVTRDQVRDHDYALQPAAYQAPRPQATRPALPEQRTPADPPDQPDPTEDRRDHRPALGAETTKDSLIGAVPDDWWVGDLHQRCEIRPGPSGSLLAASDYLPEGVPLVRAGDIRDGGIAPDPKARVSRRTAKRLSTYQLQPGDILLVRTGETTRFGIVTEQENGWLMGNTCIRLRPGPEVTPEFLAHYLNRPVVRGWLHAHTLHGSRSSINKSHLSRLQLALPPIEVQRRVVAADGRTPI